MGLNNALNRDSVSEEHLKLLSSELGGLLDQVRAVLNPLCEEAFLSNNEAIFQDYIRGILSLLELSIQTRDLMSELIHPSPLDP